MPRYIDVRIRIPVRSLGIFVDEMLPEWAEVMGFDKLDEIAKSARPNGRVHTGPRAPKGGPPAKGTAAAKLFERIKKYPGKHRADHFEALAKVGVMERAASSALYHMRDRGIIAQASDGGWSVTKEGNAA